MRHSQHCIGLIIAALFATSCTTGKGNFSLVNESKEPIIYAKVTICGQTIELRNIDPGNNAIGSYDVKSDSHYTIEVEFRSGKKLRKETGYVTNGMDFQHDISVTGSDIEVTDSKLSRKE